MLRSTLFRRGMTSSATYRNPALTVDALVARFNSASSAFEMLVIRRGRMPFKDHWAFPGGFVDYGEDPVAAVTRELEEETHLRPAPNTSPQLVSVRGHPDRDTRQHIVTIAYSVQIDPTSVDGMKGDDDAVEARWMAFEDVLGGKIQMAFDHGELAKEFHQWLTLPSKSGQDRRLFLNM